MNIGTGPDDPRAWVRAAHKLTEAADTAAPGDKLPAQHQITAELGISEATALRASRELARLGLIRLVPGHGYCPGRPGMTATADLGGWLRQQREHRSWSRTEMARRLIRVAQVSGDTAMPAATDVAANIYRWEHGKVQPSDRYRLYYCHVLGIPPGRFGDPAWDPAQDVPRSSSPSACPKAPAPSSGSPAWTPRPDPARAPEPALPRSTTPEPAAPRPLPGSSLPRQR